MTSAALSADPSPDLDEGDEYYRAAARSLIDAGQRLVAELLADQSIAPAQKAEPYERYARALRRCIALARHIDASPAKPVQTSRLGRAFARSTAIRDVELLIENNTPADRVESIRHELHERLDDPAFERDLATRPLRDIITDLKRDLGLLDTIDRRYPRRTPADIRDLEARPTRHPARPPPTGFAQPPRFIPQQRPDDG